MADTLVDSAAHGTMYVANALYGPFYISPDVGVIVFLDSNLDLSVSRTVNGGASWAKTVLSAATIVRLSVWFDQITPGDAGTVCHILWMDSATSQLQYIDYDVNADSAGTERVVNNTLAVNGNATRNRLSITKKLNGDLMVAYSTQAETGAISSSDQFATSGAVRATPYEAATQEDWVFLFPANTGDNADMCAIFIDRSSNEISLKMFDDSANTWTETIIFTNISQSITYGQFDGSVRHSDNHVLIAIYRNSNSPTSELLTADLTVDFIASPTVTTKTSVFVGVDNTAQTAMLVNQQNDDVYIGYLIGGNFTSAVDLRFSVSTDGMDTWGDAPYSENAPDDIRLLNMGRTISNLGGIMQPSFWNDDLNDIFVNLVNDVLISPMGLVAVSLPPFRKNMKPFLVR